MNYIYVYKRNKFYEKKERMNNMRLKWWKFLSNIQVVILNEKESAFKFWIIKRNKSCEKRNVKMVYPNDEGFYRNILILNNKL